MSSDILDATAFRAPAVLLCGTVDYAMYNSFRDQLGSAPEKGVVVVELSTLGGDPKVARMIGEDVRMKAIFDGLNIIYDEQETRGLVRLNLILLFFTVCVIGAVLLAIGAVVIFPLFLTTFGLSSIDQPIIGFLRLPVMFVLIIVGIAVLYRYGPSRRLAKWRWISVGSIFAASACLAVSSLFSWYLSNFANYNATYGALGAVVGLMMWMWLSTIVVLVGAELNSEIEHQTARDSTVGPEKLLGVRGAVMADTVGRRSNGDDSSAPIVTLRACAASNFLRSSCRGRRSYLAKHHVCASEARCCWADG
jgi:membrane protein